MLNYFCIPTFYETQEGLQLVRIGLMAYEYYCCCCGLFFLELKFRFREFVLLDTFVSHPFLHGIKAGHVVLLPLFILTATLQSRLEILAQILLLSVIQIVTFGLFVPHKKVSLV